jgi:hypothetical protein
MPGRVFEEPQVPRTTPLGATEPKVNWFLRSTRPQAVERRRVVNDMYSRFPDHDGGLRRRLRSRTDSDLLAALDELLVHDLLRHRYRVEYEGGTTPGTRPDFMLFNKEEHVATVEVLSLMLRGEWEAERRHHGRIEDMLNHRLRPTTHLIDFEIRQWDGYADLEHLIAWVSSTLDDLGADPGALPTGYQGVPHKLYEYGSGRLDFHFWPAPASYTPGAGDRISIGSPAIGGFVNSAHRLRRLVRSKAAKYDLRGKPFAIVVGVGDPMCDLDDVIDALTGTPAIVVATGESTRDETGVYGPQRPGGHGMRRPTLSAVFAVQEWFPAGPYRPRITRFDNPFAAVPFPADALPFGGHWGEVDRSPTRVRGDWLVPPVAPIPAPGA